MDAIQDYIGPKAPSKNARNCAISEIIEVRNQIQTKLRVVKNPHTLFENSCCYGFVLKVATPICNTAEQKEVKTETTMEVLKVPRRREPL